MIRKLSSKLLKLRPRKTLIFYASLQPFLTINEIFSYLKGRAKLRHLLKSFWTLLGLQKPRFAKKSGNYNQDCQLSLDEFCTLFTMTFLICSDSRFKICITLRAKKSPTSFPESSRLPKYNELGQIS